MIGRIDLHDCFVGGDDAFTALDARAGGAPGEPLAGPPLATVARLTRRLGVPVARSVTLADAEADLDCWVRAVPRAGGSPSR